MSDARFLQIHTLHSYAGVLLNRDDTGQAKRLLYGGVQRTRISSQCLKWHWRYPNGRDIQGGPKDVREPHAFERLERFVDSKRSRALVKEEIIAPLRNYYLLAWRKETMYAKDTDWIFPSSYTKGKTPRVGNMLVRSYLYPAAVKACVLTTTNIKVMRTKRS